MAYDELRKVTVLFGGEGSSMLFGDTWTFDGRNWNELHPATSPPARRNPMMAYDPARGVVVLFGGSQDPPNCAPCGVPAATRLNDTWTWNGLTWTERHPLHRPIARELSAFGNHGPSGRLILWGGQMTPNSTAPTDQTWAWDGTDWTQLQPATSPTRELGSGMAYDPSWHLVLFGGYSPRTPDTWTFDGMVWTDHPASASGPPFVTYPTVADDAGRSTVVMFGGNAWSPTDQTWLWNGTSWSHAKPAATPTAREHAAMAYDYARDVVVLFGGIVLTSPGGVAVQPVADTWLWDGKNWVAVP
jgi:hypothetical protein